MSPLRPGSSFFCFMKTKITHGYYEALVVTPAPWLKVEDEGTL